MKTAARYLSCSVRRWLRVLALFSTLAGWLFTPSFFASPAHAAPTTPIGATAGSFSVDGNGGANYSIPIAIPPGTAGMAPSLALSYNQQIDSGILAKGWSVSGLSVITRCGRTIPLDGQKGGVNYDDNDRFCLNGQRLVAINNGTYGANDTEYRTERESFSKIISTRDTAFTGKGPQSFKVWTASGTMMEYGLTNDARIEAQGRADTSVRLWALNKVQDRAGNYFTIAYAEDNANGEYRPTRIDYTGNSSASLTPYNSVRFVYEAQNRPDITVRYEGGSKIQSTRRLTNLQTYADNTLVRDYKLTHDNNGAVGASRLVSVQECGSDMVCLNPTMFWWVPADTGFILPDYNTFALPASLSGGWANNPSDPNHMRFADFNGDGKTDYLWKPKDGDGRWLIAYANSAGKQSDALTTITTGLNAITKVEHKPLTDNSIYIKDQTPPPGVCPKPNLAPDINCYPYLNIQNATYVVSRYTVSDGLGGEHGASYKYAGAKTHLKGGGWLGFREITVSDERSGGKVVTTHNQDFEAGTHGTAARSQNYMNGVLTSQTESFYSTRSYLTGAYAGKQKFIQLDASLSRKYELNGAELSCAQANTTYDDFGSATTVVSKVDASCGFASAFTQTTTGTYNHDTVNWRLGQLTRSQTTSEAPGTTPVTRTVAYTYSPSTGFVASDTIEPDSATLRVTNSYTYDAFGNQTRIEVSGPDFPTRATTGVNDSRGRYTLTTTNAFGHSETKVFDPKWGLATSITGPNGLTTTLDYDGLGRLISTTSPDGKIETTAMALCDGSDPDCPALARTRLTRTATSGSLTLPPSTVYVDLLGRTLRTKGQAFDGRIVFQHSEYDNLARLARSSLPYYRGNIPSQWTSNVYDAAGRATEVTGPDGSRTTTSYTGFTTCVTNALKQKSCVTANAAGQVVETTDALIGKTKYFYDAAGNVIKVIDAKNNTVLTASYDTKGRKTSMVDVDSGSRTYVYNALGELLSETDAKNQTTGVTYDLLGRIKTRTGLEGAYTWAYDTAALGSSGQQAKGRLATVSGPNYARTPAYDNYARELSVTTTINGTSYNVATNYDAHGRPDVVTYPTGFKTKNVYDAASRTVEVRDGTTSALYWQAGANAYNEHGQLLSYSLGNGLTTELGYEPVTHALKTARTGAGGVVQNLEYGFDVLGNLTSRRDNNQGYTETFGYDALNRLTQVSGPSPKSYAYDAIGNIETKSDVGAYTYHPTKVHAVVGTAGNLNTSYTYDANGNLVSGANRALDYTSFNKPKTITANGLTTIFTYGPAFERLTKTNAQGETVYLGKLYERVTQGAAVTHKHYVSSPAGLVAVVSQGATSNVRYLHGDHLGSTHAITDETGAVVERLSFDPHGKRRQPNGQDATQPIASSVNRGYTGHEMDDESGLVNMNAREYDPVLGRFMQADTVIDGGMSQGFNRYSYVGNNPLTAIDPSGNRALWKTNFDHWKKAFPYLPGALHLSGPNLPVAWIQLITVHYYTVFKPMQEDYLVEHPEAQPWVKAIGSAVLNYFGMGYLAPAINSVFDFRMCTGAGGPEDKCRIAAQKSLVSGYAVYAVSYGINSYTGGNSGGSSGYSVRGFAQHMGQALFQTAVSEIATHNDVNPLVVNIVLFAASWGGTELTGSRYDVAANDFMGWGNRGLLGFPFDIVDTLLLYQGLPTGSTLDYLEWRAWGVDNSWNVTGHSLGALEASNLVGWGLARSASVQSLPFGNIGGPHVYVVNGVADIVNGGILGYPFNSGATWVAGCTWLHMRSCY